MECQDSFTPANGTAGQLWQGKSKCSFNALSALDTEPLSLTWVDLGAVILHLRSAEGPKVKERDRERRPFWTVMRRMSAAQNCGAAQAVWATPLIGCLFASFLNSANHFRPPSPHRLSLCLFWDTPRTKKTSTKTSNWFSFRSPNFRSYGSAKPKAELKRKSTKTPQVSIPKKRF